MRIALAIVKLFASGGLQRDCMAIARRLTAQGHDVQIVCSGATVHPDDLDVVVLENRALTNHGRNQSFSRALLRHVDSSFDVVAGFDALEGLDVLYCANPPTRLRGVIDRLNPRSRALLKLERACFGPQSATHLLLLSATQRADYHRRWALDPARVTMVPPTIERNRVVAPEDRASVRARLRTDFSVAGETPVWLFVGSFPETKGLDRVIAALPSFPAARLLLVGANENALVPFRNQASQLGVAARVSWLGPREDVPALMTASDMLVHPSRLDITGTVILEAIVNGLPVIATEICGYATHIAHSRAGQVLAEPFAQSELIAALQTADAPTRMKWRGAAQRYAATVDLFSGLDIAAQAIVTTGQNSARSATRPRKMRR